jgi:hypothetical protein
MDILKAIRAGDAPREVRISAARALLPLEASAMVEVLHLLSRDEDDEVRSAAVASIVGMPDTILEAALFDEGWSAELLHFYARSCAGRPGPLEAVILNPSSPDNAILDLARTVPADLMELIVINQVRILREPRILEALLENPARNAHIRGRVNELKFDFFEKKGAPAPAAALTEELAVPDLPVEVAAPWLGSVPAAVPAESDGAEKKETLFAKLTRLDITGKIRLAKMGSREERMQLVKSPNRLICTAAVRSPKITDAEVDSIAQLRNVHEDVLRYVANKREWTRRYSLVVSLVQNPRTPIAVSLGFLNRLTPLDLRIISRNRDIPEVIRTTGRRKLAQKLSKG